MKLKRKENAIKGTIFGIIQKINKLIFPFIIRTIFLYTLGVEYLGLNSLFTSIFQVLNIAELGVGTALVFAMYKPIAENNADDICSLLGLYKKYYRIIGLIVLISGIGVSFFLPNLIATDIPGDINIYIVYYLSLAASVLSYWLFAYRNSLFLAFQKNYIISIVTTVISLCRYIADIIILVIFGNYYLFLIVNIISQVVINLILGYISYKFYPNYRAINIIDIEYKRKINSTVRDLFAGKIGAVVTMSVDTLVISAFLGLTPLAIYQNYYYIITSLIGIMNILYSSMAGGIGNSLEKASVNKNYTDFLKISYFIHFLMNFIVPCLICLYPSFMHIWVGDEELMLGIIYVILFTIYFYIYEISLLLGLYKDAAGDWHKDKFRPLIAALFNLLLNLILVNLIGLYGILLSTIISYVLINVPWIYYRLFHDIFGQDKATNYFKQLTKYFLLILLNSIVCYYICFFIKIDSFVVSFIVYLLVCLFETTLVFYLATCKQNEFSQIKRNLRDYLHKLRSNKKNK